MTTYYRYENGRVTSHDERALLDGLTPIGDMVPATRESFKSFVAVAIAMTLMFGLVHVMSALHMAGVM